LNEEQIQMQPDIISGTQRDSTDFWQRLCKTIGRIDRSMEGANPFTKKTSELSSVLA